MKDYDASNFLRLFIAQLVKHRYWALYWVHVVTSVAHSTKTISMRVDPSWRVYPLLTLRRLWSNNL